MTYEHLRYEHDGHVVTLTYDRPEVPRGLRPLTAARCALA